MARPAVHAGQLRPPAARTVVRHQAYAFLSKAPVLRLCTQVALFSDDDGQSWTSGELLPQGWTECQIAEMRNGSLLMSSRLYGTRFIPDPKTGAASHHEGLAASRMDSWKRGGRT